MFAITQISIQNKCSACTVLCILPYSTPSYSSYRWKEKAKSSQCAGRLMELMRKRASFYSAGISSFASSDSSQRAMIQSLWRSKQEDQCPEPERNVSIKRPGRTLFASWDNSAHFFQCSRKMFVQDKHPKKSAKGCNFSWTPMYILALKYYGLRLKNKTKCKNPNTLSSGYI